MYRAHPLLRAVPFAILLAAGVALGVDRGSIETDKFRQLEELLPTPNAYRTASGAPGHEYWQQEVDYSIDVVLDDEHQHIAGSETIQYTNNSPDTLSYLWVQLDSRIFAPNSHAVLTGLSRLSEKSSFSRLADMMARERFDGGCEITAVRDGDGRPLGHTIVDTMMRIDLPEPLYGGGGEITFSIDWNHAINDHDKFGGRGGFEYFEEDGNYLYEIAQWFPRLAAYTDVNGWQHKQFLGRGEFTLEFGDYDVRITVPGDHVVASTGVLQNPDEVLTNDQQERLRKAEHSSTPVFIVTPEEALENEKTPPHGDRTWHFQAENVRDFAWASSRKFIWDAVLHRVGSNRVWAMSYYPNEGEPLWSKYSTHSIVHTLNTYSRFTFDYPYPVAISVNGPVGGMEYPMICFNGPRPAKDGTYSKRSKYGLISVIIHEVGHNWFPMIVNSDERQWTWMDEGLNSFVQYLSEQEWETDYPSRAGEPQKITRYMKSDYQVPIMTNSESILQFGNNAYSKPATALNILRETIMGRELFDFAFKEYSTRWMFRRPMPADFFRTMEDASSVDLDWFWHGWFYTTGHVDLSLGDIRHYRIDSLDPTIEKPRQKKERDDDPVTLSVLRNENMPLRTEAFPELRDFYNDYDALDVTEKDQRAFGDMLAKLDDDQKALLDLDLNFYVIDITNDGDLPMPVILEAHWTDGSVEELRVPAEIWRTNRETISKLIVSAHELDYLVLDPHLETADVDLEGNRFPRLPTEHRIQLKKSSGRGGSNPMRDAQKEVERKEKEAAEEAERTSADASDNDDDGPEEEVEETPR